ncbi:hypothetical protein Godav_001345, partial [Gossypium davidsonii]|nr:hypothetical protein [Gossypium davidsonii]
CSFVSSSPAEIEPSTHSNFFAFDKTYSSQQKVHELTTLWKIETCAIIHSPDFDSQPERFLEQSIAKATQQLRKPRKVNRQTELKKVMFQSLSGKVIFQSLNAMDLNEVGLFVKQNLKDINDRVRALTKASRF